MYHYHSTARTRCGLISDIICMHQYPHPLAHAAHDVYLFCAIDPGPRVYACVLQTAEIVLENHPNVELEAVEALRERVRVRSSPELCV